MSEENTIYKLSRAQVARIAKQGKYKVGKNAIDIIAEQAENYIRGLAEDSAKLSQHAGRVMIRGDDVEFVLNLGTEPVEPVVD